MKFSRWFREIFCLNYIKQETDIFQQTMPILLQIYYMAGENNNLGLFDRWDWTKYNQGK